VNTVITWLRDRVVYRYNDIVFQFGRRSADELALDFTYPLNAVQAFGIAMSAMGMK